MPASMFHPFIVHITITLTLLFGMLDLFPKLKETRIAPTGWVIRKMTILFLGIALLSGFITLKWIEHTHPHPPQAVVIHYLLALFGSVLFLILGSNDRHFGPLWRPFAVVGGILSILTAAAVGGKLVYFSHVGTAFLPPQN